MAKTLGVDGWLCFGTKWCHLARVWWRLGENLLAAGWVDAWWVGTLRQECAIGPLLKHFCRNDDQLEHSWAMEFVMGGRRVSVAHSLLPHCAFCSSPSYYSASQFGAPSNSFHSMHSPTRNGHFLFVSMKFTAATAAAVVENICSASQYWYPRPSKILFVPKNWTLRCALKIRRPLWSSFDSFHFSVNVKFQATLIFVFFKSRRSKDVEFFPMLAYFPI